MGTELQESILKAISAVADNSIDKAKTDLTIECEIEKIQNAAKGVYTVKYTENKFTAHSTNGLSYSIGDSVYVLVPQGDFSKNKVILGLTEGAVKEKKSQVQNHYNEISPNFLNSLDEIQLCTYHTQEIEYHPADEFIGTLIQPYNNFVLKMKVRTDIKEITQRMGGNYGIIIKIPIKDVETNESILVEKTLDIKNMLGNVYSFENYSAQTLYFSFEGQRYDVEHSNDFSITAFVKGFSQDEEITTPDIFIKNIELKAVEELTQEQLEGYFFDIKCDEGFQFLSGKYTADKILIPSLLVDGVSTSVKDYECFWFKEDASIGTESEYYNAQGGAGWRILNNRIRIDIDKEGNPVYDFETLKNYEYKVKMSDVFVRARYKCILLNADTQLEKIVTISNLNSQISFSLDTPSGSHKYLKDIGDVVLDAKLHFPGATSNTLFKYRFQGFDKNNNLIENEFYTVKQLNKVTGQDHLTEITFPVKTIDEAITVKCDFVYVKILSDDTMVEETIGTDSVTLITGENLDDYIISIENGGVIYKYDANGNSPMLAAFDGPQESRLTKIEPIKLKLFRNGGDELSLSEYNFLDVTWKIPKNSMIIPDSSLAIKNEDEDYVYYKGKGLTTFPYDIDSSFDNSKNYNDTILIIASFDGREYFGRTSIKFIKDGASGTNGSQYSAIVTYKGYGYGELNEKGVPQKLRCISIDGAWKKYQNKRYEEFNYGGFPQFSVDVYKSGKKIPAQNFSVSWSMMDAQNDSANTFSIDNNGYLKTISNKNWTSLSQRPVNIVQATITTYSTSDSKTANEVLEAYYPIDVVFVGNNIPFVPSIENGFDEVLYDCDLSNPQYNTNKPFKVEILDDEIEFSLFGDWECSSGSLDKESTPSPYEREIIPKSMYEIEKVPYQNNYVAVKIKPNKLITSQKQKELKDQLNTINFSLSEITVKESFFNQISGLFDYKGYINKLDQCEKFLSYKSKYLIYLNDLLKITESLKSIDEDTYEVYYNMVSSVIYDTLNPDNIDEIECYEGGEIEIPSEVSNYQILDLIYQFNDKINECETLYNIIVNYSHAPSEITTLSTLQIDLQTLANEISAIDLENKFTDLKQTQTTIVKAIEGYIQQLQIAITKNDIVYILNNVQEILNTYIVGVDSKEKENLEEQRTSLLEELGKQTNISNFSSDGTIVIVKPIIFTVNKYGLAGVNSWDGNKLYTGTNNEYLFAPQVGAGIKDTKGFTGVVMGKRYTSSSNIDIGLFGYANTLQSFFLDAKTGDLTLGANGQGQIKFVPNGTSTIAGWNLNEDSLEKKTTNYRVGLYAGGDGDYAFEAENRKYPNSRSVRITYDGKLEAHDVDLTGKITATSGEIGGWDIKGNTLVSDGKSKIELNSNTATINIGTEIQLKGSDSTIQVGDKVSLDGINDKISIGTSIVLDGSENSIHLANKSISINGSSSTITIGLNTSTRITLDGSSAVIKSLSNTNVNYKKGFEISQNSFFVGYKAGNYLEFSNDKLIVKGEIQATTGNIGGWSLSSDGLFGNYDTYEGRYKTQLKPNFFKLGSIEIDMDNNGRFRSIYNGHAIACIKTVRQTYNGEYIGAIGVSTGQKTSSGLTDFVWLAGADKENYITISTSTETANISNVNGNGNLMCNTVNCNSIYLRGKQESITDYIDERIKKLVKSGSLK